MKKWIRPSAIALAALWMVFITWRVEQVYDQQRAAEALMSLACGYQFALYELERLNRGDPLPDHPAECDWVHLSHEMLR